MSSRPGYRRWSWIRSAKPVSASTAPDRGSGPWRRSQTRTSSTSSRASALVRVRSRMSTTAAIRTRSAAGMAWTGSPPSVECAGSSTWVPECSSRSQRPASIRPGRSRRPSRRSAARPPDDAAARPTADGTGPRSCRSSPRAPARLARYPRRGAGRRSRPGGTPMAPDWTRERGGLLLRRPVLQRRVLSLLRLLHLLRLLPSAAGSPAVGTAAAADTAAAGTAAVAGRAVDHRPAPPPAGRRANHRPDAMAAIGRRCLTGASVSLAHVRDTPETGRGHCPQKTG